MRAGAPLLAAALSAFCLCAVAQEASHQRLSVEPEPRHQVEACLGVSWKASLSDMVADLDASVEYSWKRRLGLCIALPAAAEYSGEKKAENWRLRWGDPSLSASYLWKGESLRLLASLGYAYPLDRAISRGYHAFSPALSASLVRDPVVLTVGLDARLCLPREEGGRLLWPPFSGSLSLSSWELLNDRISYRLSLSPGLSLGIVDLGSGERIVPCWSLALALTVSWDERSWALQAGWNGEVSSRPEGGRFDAKGSYRREWQ